MKLFGTDGIRGIYPDELTPHLISHLGKVLSRYILSDSDSVESSDIGSSKKLVLGYDSRNLGRSSISDLLAGMSTRSFEDIHYLGVAPTPLVAFFSATDFVWGLSITASHNPHPYTGLKIFAPGGKKLSDAIATEIEKELQEHLKHDEVPYFEPDRKLEAEASTPPKSDIFSQVDVSRLPEYYDWLVENSGSPDLSGLKVLVDPANGAVSALLPEVLNNLGVETDIICGSPDGKNINHNCGSTYPGTLLSAFDISTANYDLGLMFDGDGDRLLACVKSSESGKARLVDGDEILAVLALDMKARSKLKNNSVAVTTMTNMGFLRAMKSAGISVRVTPVGDKYVAKAMEESGAVLGGEQSGHIIFGDTHFPLVGDGLLTAIRFMGVIKSSDKSPGELVEESMTRTPQVLHKVELSTSPEFLHAALLNDIRAIEKKLGENGRVVVRPSGTEPVWRILVEGEDEALIQALAEELSTKAERLQERS